jgi:hypothetical protein
MAAKIVVLRRTGKVDRFRSYRVLVDGERVGSLRQGEQKEFDVAPGRHKVEVIVDWGRSPAISVDLKPTDSVRLECTSQASISSAVFRIFFRRRQYLSLRRVDDPDGLHSGGGRTASGAGLSSENT